MTQTMILMGVLAICAVSGALLTYRPGWTRGPDEPKGSYPSPSPPAPSPAPAATPSTLPPPPVASAKPSQPVFSVAPPAPVAASPVVASPVRRNRNNGFARFATPAARTRTRTSRA